MKPFHLAIQVKDLQKALVFYTEVLNCQTGRKSDTWIDFNLYGHQLVCHENKEMNQKHTNNVVDGHGVPVPHFGVVLGMLEWQKLADNLAEKEIDFIVEPTVRFKGGPGEQATMFISDPFGNAIEFKGFKDIESQLFAC